MPEFVWVIDNEVCKFQENLLSSNEIKLDFLPNDLRLLLSIFCWFLFTYKTNQKALWELMQVITVLDRIP